MLKKKKFLKQLIPLLIALKVKLSAFAVIAYIVIALIAKKALLASLISLLVSGFIGIRKLLANQHHAPHHEVVSLVKCRVKRSSGWQGGFVYMFNARDECCTIITHVAGC